MPALNIYFDSLFPDKKDEKDFYLEALRPHQDFITIGASPLNSDANVITDIFDTKDFQFVQQHPLIKDYPEKTFVITESDQPVEIWPGLYTCGIRSSHNNNPIHGWYYPYFRVRFPNQELLKMGNPEKCEKKYLASFVGYPSHILRKELANMWTDNPEIYYSSGKDYHHFEIQDEQSVRSPQRHYIETILSSRFSICPRGRGPATIRLFETMQLGVAPVILSDNWLRPDYVDWKSCSITIPEKNRKHAYRILKENEHRSEELGINAQKAFNEFFAENCLGKSLRTALNQLIEAQKMNGNPGNYNPAGRIRNRKSRYKIDYFKALVYGAFERAFKN